MVAMRIVIIGSLALVFRDGDTDNQRPGPSAQETGQPRRSPHDARRDLRMVHRGFDTADLKEVKALLGELSALTV